MKTIDLDDDLYLYIASQTRHIGESASDILRRLLGQTHPSAAAVATLPLVATMEQIDAPISQGAHTEVEGAQLQQLLDSELLTKEAKSINRFMLILSALYQDNPDGFTQATEIKGRKRVYFSRDSQALSTSGSTTKPKPVPDTPFWVITNTNTSRKQNMVAQVMASMGYEQLMISQVCNLI